LPGPTATTGDPNAPVPGALGDPTTVILNRGTYGDFPASAGRFTLTRWLGEPGFCRVDVSYMLVEQRSSTFGAASDGSPTSAVLARPFFNPVQNREDADPRAIPGVMAGAISDGVVTRFQQAEANLRFYFGDRRNSGLVLCALAGARVMQLNERYASNDTVTDLPLGAPFAQRFFISDRVATYNDFYGGQAGVSATWRYDALSLEILGKVAGGMNRQSQQLSGLTTITNQNTNQSVSDTIGLYVQRSNSGTNRSNHFAYVPELTVNLSALMWERCRLKVGYDLFSFNGVLRPGQALDRNVNIQPLLAPVQQGVALPQPLIGNRTGFTLQGLSFGLELLF
jgi:hypothetical protein